MKETVLTVFLIASTAAYDVNAQHITVNNESYEPVHVLVTNKNLCNKTFKAVTEEPTNRSYEKIVYNHVCAQGPIASGKHKAFSIPNTSRKYNIHIGGKFAVATKSPLFIVYKKARRIKAGKTVHFTNPKL